MVVQRRDGPRRLRDRDDDDDDRPDRPVLIYCKVAHSPVLDYRSYGSGADLGSWQSVCR